MGQQFSAGPENLNDLTTLLIGRRKNAATEMLSTVVPHNNLGTPAPHVFRDEVEEIRRGHALALSDASRRFSNCSLLYRRLRKCR